MIIWFLVYVVFWLSYSVAIWVNFGGLKFTETSANNPICVDVSEVALNTANNCSTVQLTLNNQPQFPSFDTTAYYLFRITLGYGNLDETDMETIDPTMTNLLVSTYTAFTYLILINIFIALLSATFSR